MQQYITAAPAAWIPGEFATTNPRRVDSFESDGTVEFGLGVKVENGIAKKADANATGVAVTTHQHVANNGPSDGYAPSLVARAGDAVGICSMGDVCVSAEVAAPTWGSDPKKFQEKFAEEWKKADPLTGGTFCGIAATRLPDPPGMPVPPFTAFYDASSGTPSLRDGVEKVTRAVAIRIG